jgi:hypothetical protein
MPEQEREKKSAKRPPAGVPITDWGRAAVYVSLADAAATASVSYRTIRRWIALGLVRASKPQGTTGRRGGGLVLVERDSLRRFLEQATITPNAAA